MRLPLPGHSQQPISSPVGEAYTKYKNDLHEEDNLAYLERLVLRKSSFMSPRSLLVDDPTPKNSCVAHLLSIREGNFQLSIDALTKVEAL